MCVCHVRTLRFCFATFNQFKRLTSRLKTLTSKWITLSNYRSRSARGSELQAVQYKGAIFMGTHFYESLKKPSCSNKIFNFVTRPQPMTTPPILHCKSMATSRTLGAIQHGSLEANIACAGLWSKAYLAINACCMLNRVCVTMIVLCSCLLTSSLTVVNISLLTVVNKVLGEWQYCTGWK